MRTIARRVSMCARLGVVAVAGLAVIAVPPLLAQDVPPVVLEGTQRHRLYSEAVADDYDIQVALPPRYEPDEGTYPLVLATDAGMTFSTLFGVTRVMMAEGELPPVIIVGIGYPEPGDGWTKRFRDFTPTHEESWSQCRDHDFRCGGSDAFLSFIREELLPFLVDQYSIDPGNMIYLGHSLGGLFGGWVMFEAPETFRGYILGSPYFKWDEQVVFDHEASYWERSRELPLSLYMAVGGAEETPGVPHSGDEAVTHFQLMHDRLVEREYEGLEVTAEVIPGEIHVAVFPTLATRGLRAMLREEFFWPMNDP